MEKTVKKKGVSEKKIFRFHYMPYREITPRLQKPMFFSILHIERKLASHLELVSQLCFN